MSESQRTVVQSLLLSAPKERRLDLAIASVLSTGRKEYVEVVLLGQRQVVPVSFFFAGKRGYDVFFFSPELTISFPGQASKPAPASVPAYVRDPEWAWQGEEFVFRSNVTCSRGELVVGVSNGAQTWEEHTLVDSRLQKERETCRLLILATLRAYAPGLLPLLETEGQKEEGGTENHPAAQTSLIQELVFVPVILPKKPFFEHCQFKLNREEKLITMLVKAIIGDILFEVRRCLLLFLIAKRAVRKSRYSKKSVANQMCWFLE